MLDVLATWSKGGSWKEARSAINNAELSRRFRDSRVGALSEVRKPTMCFNCRQPGHELSECPEASSAGAKSRPATAQGKICFKVRCFQMIVSGNCQNRQSPLFPNKLYFQI